MPVGVPVNVPFALPLALPWPATQCDRAATVSRANRHRCSALASQLNVFARARPFARAAARASGSRTTFATASASASSSPSGTSTAAPPLTSRRAGTSVVTTGVPHAIASTTGKPKPSKWDGYASTSAPPYSATRSPSGT